MGFAEEFSGGNYFAGSGQEFSAVASGSSLDADVQAFITAAGITDATQKSAVNQLVLDLKAASLWTKMYAIYPFVGGTAASHKWNLKDPRDLDAAFRITFNGGLTHSSNGVLPNGSTGYADTHFTPSASWTNLDTHVSFYSRTNAIADTDDFGVGNAGPTVYIQVLIRTSALGGSQMLSDAYNGRANGTVADSLGLFTQSIESGHHQIYRDGTLIVHAGDPGSDITTVTASLTFFALNLDGSISGYSSRQCAFASIGSGLTATDVANLYTAVQAFNTTLGRQV